MKIMAFPWCKTPLFGLSPGRKSAHDFQFCHCSLQLCSGQLKPLGEQLAGKRADEELNKLKCGILRQKAEF